MAKKWSEIKFKGKKPDKNRMPCPFCGLNGSGNEAKKMPKTDHVPITNVKSVVSPDWEV